MTRHDPLDISRHARLVFLPGLFADARLFERQMPVFPHSVVAEWEAPEPNDSLVDYGVRALERVGVRPGDSSKPLVLVGQSFGGVLAQALAREIDVAGVVLIASVRHHGEFSGMFQRIGDVLRLLPASWNEAMLRRSMRGFVRQTAKSDDPEMRIAGEMAEGFPHEVFFWSGERVRGFDVPEHELGVPSARIHGKKDQAIPVKRIRGEIDLLVDAGGHKVNWSHPDAVNAFIADWVRGLLV
ncbi:MAG: alpha/beta hydrolase [Planctomycetota bacterium]